MRNLFGLKVQTQHTASSSNMVIEQGNWLACEQMTWNHVCDTEQATRNQTEKLNKYLFIQFFEIQEHKLKMFTTLVGVALWEESTALSSH